jgi:hypothetical protein
MNGEIELMGAGTQKLEEYLLEKFPTAIIERLDQDATKNKEILTDVIGKLIAHKIDILTGTQMIAKVTDAVQLGEKVPVILKEIDEKGRYNLSIKGADPEFAARKGLTPAPQGDHAKGDRKPGDRHSRFDRGI